MTDIATGWTETAAVRNKASRRMMQALDAIAAALPFPFVGIDSDNGSSWYHQLIPPNYAATWLSCSNSCSKPPPKATPPGTPHPPRAQPPEATPPGSLA